MEVLAYLLIFVAFVVSASAGMGGSLLLLPVLSFLLGFNEGVVLSSILLGLNNVFKLIAFFKHLVWRNVLPLLCSISIGSALGAFLFLKMSSNVVAILLLINIVVTFLVQRKAIPKIQYRAAVSVSFLAGLLSGVSGSSGPLKGLAIKCLKNTPLQIVACATVLSLSSDVVKSTIYLNHLTLSTQAMQYLFGSLLLMPLATYLGKKINSNIGTTAYDVLFYSVISGYVVRLLL